MINFIINKILKWKGVPNSHDLLDNIPEPSLSSYTEEAKYMKSLGYYKWLMEDLELMAERWMFKGNKESLLIGKGILYCLNIQKKNISLMADGRIKKDSNRKKDMTRFK